MKGTERVFVNRTRSAVLEIGKDIVRTTLAIMETRSGKKIEYQDEEARKVQKSPSKP